MLKMAGIQLPPAMRAGIGIALIAVGAAVHRPMLIVIGAVFVLTGLSGVATAIGERPTDQRRR